MRGARPDVVRDRQTNAAHDGVVRGMLSLPSPSTPSAGPRVRGMRRSGTNLPVTG
jgi:hypothetical protein